MMWSSIQLAEHACAYIEKLTNLLPKQKSPQLPNLKKKKKKKKKKTPQQPKQKKKKKKKKKKKGISEIGKYYYQHLPIKLILTRNWSKTVFFSKTAKIKFPYVKINLAS